ncbi:MAG TPA: deoxyribodipyrimidine photo-lyase [Opitutus sp.]|nr:deoxyribodipyrimidine photo-lyase [Opitutus sp.]
MSATLVWFRQDLRLQDNAALNAAVARGGAVVPVFILDEAGEGRWPIGGAARWWLHHSLAALDAALRERRSRLLLARGDSLETLRRLVAATGADAIYWNRRYEPAALARDAQVTREFGADGVDVKAFPGALLHEPEEIINRQGRPYQVFTPFWRHCLTLPVAVPRKMREDILPAPTAWPGSIVLDGLQLLPRLKWADGFGREWSPGEANALAQLDRFVANAIDGYAEGRDRPDREATSRFSAALHFGEITPRQIWAAVKARAKDAGTFPGGEGARVFLSEIGWREFAHHVLVNWPDSPAAPLRGEFARFAWADDPGDAKLRAWQRGRTGYPIVDAGMRQLWATGWMHNRVRMIVASFLVKHLRLPWSRGAEWFWDTLVDADLANNTLNWQWSAGCGADAAPYFRIFAPVTQGRKFDPDGAYVRRWVPELARMPAKWIHAPWEAPVDTLVAAGVRLGENYPRPIVDHATARAEALAAFRALRSGAGPA